MKPSSRKSLSWLASRAAAATLAVFSCMAAHADGTETLGPPSIAIASGSGLATAGFGLKTALTDSDILVVPVNAQVQQVLLYWEGRRSSNGRVMLNGQIVIGQEIGGPAPPFDNNPTFRADVTGLNFVQPGANSLTVSLLPAGFDEVQGAGVVAIYNEASVVTYGGRSFGLQAKVGPTVNRIGDTGSLPPQGGDLTPAPVVDTKLLNIVSARVVGSRTLGAASQTESTVAVSNVSALVSAIGIKADVIESRALARCTTTGPAVSGNASFLGLKIGSFNQPISFAPNRVLLNIPGVIRVVANEQTQSVVGTTGRITVNGLHVSSPLLALVLPVDVIVASTSAEVNCAGGIGRSFLEIRDGNDYAFKTISAEFPTAAGTVPQIFTFSPSPVARVAYVDLFVANAQAFVPAGDNAVIEIRVDGNVVYSEREVLNSVDGPNWDSPRIPLVIPAGASSVTVEIISDDENFLWLYASLVVPEISNSNLFSGQATVATVDLKHLGGVAVADTGPLPSSGGRLDATVSALAQPLGAGLLSATTGGASTVGAGDNSRATAFIESLNLSAFGINLSASVVRSTANASCDANNIATVNGKSEIANLLVLGLPVVVSPGYEIPLPLGGKLILDEQIVEQSAPNIASITVNAIRLYLPAQAPGFEDKKLIDVKIASSHADIVCR